MIDPQVLKKVMSIKPQKGEMDLLKQCQPLSHVARDQRHLQLERFVARASRLRKVNRPWLRVHKGRGAKAREGWLIPDQNMIILGGCSWFSMLHEWHHWLVGDRLGWDLAETVEADLAAEAFARAILYYLNPRSPEAKESLRLAHLAFYRPAFRRCLEQDLSLGSIVVWYLMTILKVEQILKGEDDGDISTRMPDIGDNSADHNGTGSKKNRS